MKRQAIYPGTFDPITNGHLDVINRALEMFDVVHVAIARNVSKNALFSPDERIELIKEVTKSVDGVEVEFFDGLIVDYAAQKNVGTIVRGLRAISDFDYEFQMALTNRKLSSDIQTVFLMPSEDNFYISSTMIKEIATLKGDVSKFVPEFVVEQLSKKLI